VEDEEPFSSWVMVPLLYYFFSFPSERKTEREEMLVE
jgi:hypothetical protein